MATILSVSNQKGGSGKTTLAVNLARVFARSGPAVLVDADPQRSASGFLESSPELPVVSAPDVAALQRVLRESRTAAGFVVIDCPPILPDVNAAAVAAADVVLVPCNPSPLDIAAAAPLLEALAAGKRAALVVLCRVPPGLSAAVARDALKPFGVPVARTEIRNRVAHSWAAADRLAVVDAAPRSPAAREMEALVREIRAALKGPGRRPEGRKT